MPMATEAAATDTSGHSAAGSGDSLGDWLYQLNPMYWLKSKQERALIDKEKDAWSKNADLQEKIDSIKTRLIRNYGYNDESAKDVLDWVGSIFARGEGQE